jgi:hypothetical protein
MIGPELTMISHAENLLPSTSLGILVTKLAAHLEQRCTQLLNFANQVILTICGQVLILEEYRLLVDLVTQLPR